MAPQAQDLLGAAGPGIFGAAGPEFASALQARDLLYGAAGPHNVFAPQARGIQQFASSGISMFSNDQNI